MKKITLTLISIILCSFLFATFNACGLTGQKTLNDKTSKQVYNQVVSMVNNAKNDFSYNVDYTIKETLLSSNAAPVNERKLNTSLQKNQNNYVYTTYFYMPSFAVDNTTLTIKQTYTFFDQVLYRVYESSLNGNQVVNKTKGDYSYALSLVLLGKLEKDFLNPLYDFSGYNFDKVYFNKIEDEFCFELKLKDKEIKDFTKDIVLASNVSTSEYSCEQVSYKFFVDQNASFIRAEIAFTIATSLNGSNYEYKYKGVITFSDIGETSISAPTDPDSYISNN